MSYLIGYMEISSFYWAFKSEQGKKYRSIRKRKNNKKYEFNFLIKYKIRHKFGVFFFRCQNVNIF